MTKTQHDSETAAPGEQVITACAFIHRVVDGQRCVFLPKRADTKKFLPGVYELPGGHIDFGENVVKGLQREINEEFGVSIKVGDPFFVFDYLNEVKGSHSIEVIYFATLSQKNQDITLNPEDHSEAVWISEAELPSLYSEDKPEHDIEFQAIRKGFALLRGERLDCAD